MGWIIISRTLRDLVIEGIERPQMRALVLRRKKAGQIAILVVAANDVMAIGSRL